jgi:hypothetical protein
MSRVNSRFKIYTKHQECTQKIGSTPDVFAITAIFENNKTIIGEKILL